MPAALGAGSAALWFLTPPLKPLGAHVPLLKTTWLIRPSSFHFALRSASTLALPLTCPSSPWLLISYPLPVHTGRPASASACLSPSFKPALITGCGRNRLLFAAVSRRRKLASPLLQFAASPLFCLPWALPAMPAPMLSAGSASAFLSPAHTRFKTYALGRQRQAASRQEQAKPALLLAVRAACLLVTLWSLPAKPGAK